MAAYNLSHPLYLDVQMMVSFLAFLEGGVTFEEDQTLRSTETGNRSGKASGKFKFPTIASWLGAEVSGEAAIDKKLDESSEYKSAKHHTAASLFNYLYAYLSEDNSITVVDTPQEASALKSGQLVQISGRYLGNTLADVLQYFNHLLPYLEQEAAEQEETRRAQERSRRRSGNPAVRATTGTAAEEEDPTPDNDTSLTDILRVAKMMQEDIASVPVRDLLLSTSGGLNAVLTVSSEYYSTETSEHLRAGEFVVLGKVTRILREHDSINLARRTAIGVMDQEAVRDIVVELAGAFSISAESANPIVSAPAVQVLPMAIFI
jgi:hypothetical protein